MMRVGLTIVLSTLIVSGVGCARHDHAARVDQNGRAVPQERAEVLNRMSDSGKVLTELTAAPDQGIPENVLAEAKCVAIVPDMVKGGFIVGAQHGRGVATCRTSNGWTAPAFFTLTGGNWGAQIGAESVDLVMLSMNDQGMQDMLKNKFKIGADAAASAGPVGRNAQAGTDWKMNAELLTYSRSKGLFAGIDLDGSVLSQNEDDTRVIYGDAVPFDTILKGNKATPEEARPFVRTVAKYFVVAKAENK